MPRLVNGHGFAMRHPETRPVAVLDRRQDGIAPPDEVGNGCRKQDGLNHVADETIALDQKIAMVARFLPVWLADVGINGNDPAAILKGGRQAIREHVPRHPDVSASAGLVPAVRIAGKEQGAAGHAVKDVVFDTDRTRRVQQQAACPIPRHDIPSKHDARLYAPGTVPVVPLNSDLPLQQTRTGTCPTP